MNRSGSGLRQRDWLGWIELEGSGGKEIGPDEMELDESGAGLSE